MGRHPNLVLLLLLLLLLIREFSSLLPQKVFLILSFLLLMAFVQLCSLQSSSREQAKHLDALDQRARHEPVVVFLLFLFVVSFILDGTRSRPWRSTRVSLRARW